MHDELTQVDIDKMQAELEHRIHDLRPKLIEEVKVARSFGRKAREKPQRQPHSLLAEHDQDRRGHRAQRRSRRRGSL